MSYGPGCLEPVQLTACCCGLQARSPLFRALLTGPMMEGHQETVAIHDVKAPVFKALLHFAYTDSLPDELEGEQFEGQGVALASAPLGGGGDYFV